MSDQHKPTPALWTYRATVKRWLDGDTFDAQVDLGFRTYRTERLRLLGSAAGIDTPELSSRDPVVRARAQQAARRSAELCPVESVQIVRTHRAEAGDPRDGFGRYLAQIILADGRSLGDVLLAEGLAEPYARG